MSVIIPALDEEEAIQSVIRRVPAWADEIIVVDNGSRDGTHRAAASAGARVVGPTSGTGGLAWRRRPHAAWCALLAALMTGGCHHSLRLPDLAGLYDGAAKRHEPWRNPVVVIPGFLGSKLVDSRNGQVAWGAFDVGWGAGRNREAMQRIALPMNEGVELSALVDGVRPDGALDRVRLRWLGLPLQLKAYAYILASLGVGGYRDETLGMAGAVDYGSDHYTCFQFDYDWRRDIPENARRLGAFLREKEAYVRKEYERRSGVSLEGPIRFDVVAHSMGGLILRWFLRYGDAEPDPEGTPQEVTSTAEVVQLQRGSSRLTWMEGGPGDGTVLRASALGDERLGTPVSDAGWVPQLVSPVA